MATSRVEKISSTFILRRVHSLMGLWLILYLFEHLLVNSQAALWVGDDGAIFIKLVNQLESLPYLQVIEWLFIGIPLLVHGIWGIKRALEPKLNASGGGENTARLVYSRNHAFTWQRITSWILLVGIVGHVVQMRFVSYPTKVEKDNRHYYLTRISFDEGLYTLSKRLHVTLYTPAMIAALERQMPGQRMPPLAAAAPYSEERQEEFARVQLVVQERKWAAALVSFHLETDEVIAEAPTPGTAMLLMVRNHFKSPLMIALYTLFVLAASFHAFNGLWTALITWGAILSYRSQKAMIPVSIAGVLIVAFLGLAAIWGTWFNLRS